MRWVKSYNPDGTSSYFRSVEECCKVFGIKYHQTLIRLIENGQLAEDGKTFFDYPTDYEVKVLEKKYGEKTNEENRRKRILRRVQQDNAEMP